MYEKMKGTSNEDEINEPTEWKWERVSNRLPALSLTGMCQLLSVIQNLFLPA